uniref:MoaD/ThiS family protein n=1 Tax=candidate division WOR-3 bacterium TaxID=2052148 RepID=A0A7C2NYR2_UNCW3
MKVKIKGVLHLKELIGNERELDIPENLKIGELLSCFLPQLKDLNSPMRILINGQSINFLNGMETLLKEGDEITFLPFATGG